MSYCKGIEELIGKTVVNITRGEEDSLEFETDDGYIFKMYHEQDCCEHVFIDDINGDLEDLMDSPITEASERTSHEGEGEENGYDSCTWTFYHIATIKGWVTIKWFGTSNGYYSESVSVIKYKTDT
jgi:hypothetical protein